MTSKEFFKRFKWGVVLPAALYFIIGVLTASMYPSVIAGKPAAYAYEFVTAILALAAGAAVIAYYFLGRDESIFHLLSGVGALAVAVYLFVPTLVKWSVVPIALGVSAVLHAASECYEGIRTLKKSRTVGGVRIALGVAFVALGVLSCVRLMDTTRADWLFTGLVYLAEAVVLIAFAWAGGLFDEEETLKFRPVKGEADGKGSTDGDAEGGEEETPAEKPARKGAHRR